jgi:hypothetical protein
LVVSCPDPPLDLYGMKMTGKLVSERVCRFEAASPGKILAGPRKFAAYGDFSKEPLKDLRLGSEAS